MNEEDYYQFLWKAKKGAGNPNAQRRDWLHRRVLDNLFDPLVNDRIEVAATMLQGGHALLDLGIWGGDFLNLLQIKRKFTVRCGLDVVPESVDEAITRGIEAQVWNLNFFPYPFDSEQFDAVTLLAVIEHLFDPEKVIAEVNRLLRPGGQVILCVPNVASLSNRLRLLSGRLPVTSLDPGWDGGHLHYFTFGETKRLMMRHGFRDFNIGISGGGQWLRQQWPALLAGEFLISGIKEE